MKKQNLTIGSPEYSSLVEKLKNTKFSFQSRTEIPSIPSIPSIPTKTGAIALRIHTKTGTISDECIKDLDLLILKELDDKDLFNVCLVDKYISGICKDENFWRERFINKHRNYNKKSNQKWKELHLKVNNGYNLFREGDSVRGYVSKNKRNPNDQLVLIDLEIYPYKNSKAAKRTLWGLIKHENHFQAYKPVVEDFSLETPLFERSKQLSEWENENYNKKYTPGDEIISIGFSFYK